MLCFLLTQGHDLQGFSSNVSTMFELFKLCTAPCAYEALQLP